MTIYLKNKHTLQVDEFSFKCSIGKKGLTTNKKEGDKKHLKENLIYKTFILEKIELVNLKPL